MKKYFEVISITLAFAVSAAVAFLIFRIVSTAASGDYQVLSSFNSAGMNAFGDILLFVSILLSVVSGYAVYVNLSPVISNNVIRQIAATIPCGFVLVTLICHFVYMFTGGEAFAWIILTYFTVCKYVLVFSLIVFMILFAWKDERVRTFLLVAFSVFALAALAHTWNAFMSFKLIVNSMAQ